MIGIGTDFANLSGERSYSLSYYTKGALTHHTEGAVVFPAEIVRSARRMRLLRKPPDNATTPAGAAAIVCADGNSLR